MEVRKEKTEALYLALLIKIVYHVEVTNLQTQNGANTYEDGGIRCYAGSFEQLDLAFDGKKSSHRTDLAR
jgi:hypothetical protein